MAFSINGNDITMVRGDTLRLKVKAFDKNGVLYVPQAGDKIVFAVKSSYNDPMAKIVKEIPYDTMELCLVPKDTKWLPQPSTYVYEISITMADGTVDTFIQGKLFIKQEVL